MTLSKNIPARNLPFIKTGLGQDSHTFDLESEGPIILGSVAIEHAYCLKGNSDSDVILHALTNAISSVTGVNILGEIADSLCKQGITNSTAYLVEALKYLHDYEISNIAISLECLRPKISNYVLKIRQAVAHLCNIDPSQVGLTATSGEGLTSFGRGEGVACFVIVTFQRLELSNS